MLKALGICFRIFETTGVSTFCSIISQALGLCGSPQARSGTFCIRFTTTNVLDRLQVTLNHLCLHCCYFLDVCLGCLLHYTVNTDLILDVSRVERGLQ